MQAGGVLEIYPPKEIKMFKLVVTTYNSEKWIAKCLKSIQSQTVRDFSCVFVDDASTDNTYKVALDTVANDRRFKVLRNQKNMKQMCSIKQGIAKLTPTDEDVIVQIDGDDWLKHPKVLERVKTEYDKGAYLTYGQFEYYPSGLFRVVFRKDFAKIGPCAPYPPQILENRDFRKYKWVGSHLKTFKYFLFKRVKTSEFLDDKGEWLTSAADMAFMFPMMEMVGSKITFIPQVLYVYNRANPLRRDKIALRDQLRCDKLIIGRKKYPLLKLK